MSFETQRESLWLAVRSLGRLLYRWGLVAASDGNVSVRVGEKSFWITASGVAKARLKVEDLVFLEKQNEQWEQVFGDKAASSEWRLHAAIYEATALAQWVAHFHPPYGVALSLKYESQGFLPNDVLGEMILSVGSIPVLPYLLPGSAELAQQVGQVAAQHRVMLLARHGAIVWAQTQDELQFAIERLHHITWMLYLIELMGQPIARIEPRLVEALWKRRAQIGPRTW